MYFQMFFDIVLKKNSSGFDAFCDVIKFKYKGVYNILTDAKNAPFLNDRPGKFCALFGGSEKL